MPAAPATDDLFDDEEDGGDGCVEGRCEAGRSAYRCDQAKALARELQAASYGQRLDPAPICNEGSSGPRDCPLPMARALSLTKGLSR